MNGLTFLKIHYFPGHPIPCLCGSVQAEVFKHSPRLGKLLAQKPGVYDVPWILYLPLPIPFPYFVIPFPSLSPFSLASYLSAFIFLVGSMNLELNTPLIRKNAYKSIDPQNCNCFINTHSSRIHKNTFATALLD